MNGIFDTRRVFRCPACGQVVYLTRKWTYPRHEVPDGYPEDCRRSYTESHIERDYDAAQESGSASAVSALRGRLVDSIVKVNQLEIGLGQEARTNQEEQSS